MKELTLVNRLHERSITIAVPERIYNNYVLSGDRAEVDYYLEIELPEDNPDVLRRVKNTLCQDEESHIYDYIIVDDEDQNFMDIKESELKMLMSNDYVGVDG